ncbi:hypothetical protein Tco_0148932 [Tanacetum coccineum]
MILNELETKNKQLLVKTINNQSVEINDLKVQLQDKLHVITELKHLLAQKWQKTQCESPVLDSRIQKIEDENVLLAFQVSSLVKESKHIKLEYKKCYDSIKQTWAKMKLQTDSLQLKFIPKVVEKNDLSKSVTSHLTTNKIIEKCKKFLPQTDNTMLPSTGRVSSTNASESKPKSNTKNDRIPQSSSRSIKNKVEAHHRKFKSSANKNNHVLDCNVNVKNVVLSKNSDTICLSCNKCLFSANHDACVV